MAHALVCAAALIAMAAPAAVAETAPAERVAPLPVHDARLRLSFERVGMPAEGEAPMGLFGLNLDVRPSPYWHIGLGGYGAATGERGGFFTGGFQGGVRLPLAGPLFAEGGLFLGAGGGASAGQGGGLMLRPHAGLSVDLRGRAGPVSGAGVHAAQVYFPNGGIRSSHVGFFLEAPWPVVVLAGHPPADDFGAGSSEASSDRGSVRTMRFTGDVYLPLGGSRIRSGSPLRNEVGMLGFEYRAFFTPRIFGVVEPRGAALGASDGFAEITAGAGYALPLDVAGHTHVYARGGIGGAGGGRVDTGGGLVVRASAGIDAELPGAFHIGLDAGALEAPTGSFRALSLGLRLGTSMRALHQPGTVAGPYAGERPASLAGWRVRPGHISHLDLERRGNREELRVDLLSLKIDHFVSEHVYVSGQAAGAYAGKAGGFATGLIGVGAQTAAWNRLRFSAEALIGAAGGGGVDVGQGLIAQPTAGVSVDLSDALSVEAAAGWLASPTGPARTPVVGAGLSYAFSTPRL